jgi:hypothetical protein
MSDELSALKNELADLAASMKANHLKAAKVLVDGKTQEEAYKLSGGKAKDAYAGASEMLRLNPKISQYRELVQKIAAIELLPKQVGTLEQKRSLLWGIALHGTEKIVIPMKKGGDEDEVVEVCMGMRDMKAATGAIAELNKMDGDLATIKTENKHSHTFDDLTEEQLNVRIAELSRKAGAGVST